MQALPFGRVNVAQTVLVSSLTLVAVALLGMVLSFFADRVLAAARPGTPVLFISEISTQPRSGDSQE